jgi:hypothetical protein
MTGCLCDLVFSQDMLIIKMLLRNFSGNTEPELDFLGSRHHPPLPLSLCRLLRLCYSLLGLQQPCSLEPQLWTHTESGADHVTSHIDLILGNCIVLWLMIDVCIREDITTRGHQPVVISISLMALW